MSEALEELFVDEYRELKERCSELKYDNDVLKKSVKNLEDEISRMGERAVRDLGRPCKLARIMVFSPNTKGMSIEEMQSVVEKDNDELYNWGCMNVDACGFSFISEKVHDFPHTVIIDGNICAIDLKEFEGIVVVKDCNEIGKWFYASNLNAARIHAAKKMREMLMVAINETTDAE